MLILQVADTSERDRALHKLEEEKEARRRAELDAAQTRHKLDMAVMEYKKIKEEMERTKQLLNR